MQHQLQHQTTVAASTPPSTTGDAPPKQVALALERLNHATGVIADIRLGADRLIEALFAAAEPHKSSKPLDLFIKGDSAMRQHLQDLRSIGKQLEESGVLNESLRSRGNSWGLHMPLVCPDGAVVAYAWKRQLAGQAGTSAVDRTRLALKAFTDQKRHFFPRLDDGLMESESASKKHCGARAFGENNQDEPSNYKTLHDVQTCLEKEVPNLKMFTYERVDWLKRASSLPASVNDNSMEGPKHNFHGSSILRPASQGVVPSDKVAVIELLFPSIFRAIVSVHPAGSIDPDTVAFFSPDERNLIAGAYIHVLQQGGSYIHAQGSSVSHVFRHIREHAALALQYFIGIKNETALYSLLHWICTYQTLFSKVCSKCGRLLAMDRQSALLLPPVYRPYRNFSSKASSTGENPHAAYHIDCYSDEPL